MSQIPGLVVVQNPLSMPVNNLYQAEPNSTDCTPTILADGSNTVETKLSEEVSYLLISLR